MEGAGGRAVARATSTITLASPVKRRYVVAGLAAAHQPTVKVIVTETDGELTEACLDRPRRPRKSDLSKCIKEAVQAPGPAQQQVIYLGGEEVGLDLSLRGAQAQDTGHSIGRWTEETGPDPIYYVQCPECNKKLKQKSFRSHVRTHTGVKQFKCDLCDDRFTRRNDVMRHKRLIHEKPRDFQCEQCQKYFVSEENLVLHVEKHKTQMKCRVCEHGFGKREYYENHIKYVHPEGGHPPDEKSDDELNELSSEAVDSPQYAENPDPKPAIIRKPDQQKFEDLAQKDLKIIYLGEREEETNSVASPTPAPVPVPANMKATGAQDETDKRDGAIQIVDDSGNVGQILKISDGTFMIVDCKEDPSPESKVKSTEESPDAVQTLIDAVQELIQTHEAWQEGDDAEKKEPVGVSELPSEAADEVETAEGAGGLAPEVWSSLRREYPGAQFVVVTDQ